MCIHLPYRSELPETHTTFHGNSSTCMYRIPLPEENINSLCYSISLFINSCFFYIVLKTTFASFTFLLGNRSLPFPHMKDTNRFSPGHCPSPDSRFTFPDLHICHPHFPFGQPVSCVECLNATSPLQESPKRERTISTLRYLSQKRMGLHAFSAVPPQEGHGHLSERHLPHRSFPCVCRVLPISHRCAGIPIPSQRHLP